ncbi:MAG: OmpA family protein [Thermoanaerobaculia bacterium]|nr:OmpA family protein [Thermoanaerobaculia bacterium]
MQRSLVTTFLALMMAASLAAQPDQAITIDQAQQAFNAAQTAGAATLARELYDEAQWRLRQAHENWDAKKRDDRDNARIKALEALWASRAALAKSQWLSANASIRGLQGDIVRFGGNAPLDIEDEAAGLAFARGTTSKQRVESAQRAIDRAKAAGGQSVPANELSIAQANLDSAKKIVKVDSQNDSADHLAYVAEMRARRALYLAFLTDSIKYLQPLQMERTRLAQAAAELSAAAERTRREQAEREAAEMQRRLAVEASSREAQAVEVDRLRQQVEENRRMMEQRVEQDRLARIEAQRQLDDVMKRYESAIGSASSAEIETLRRQVEDQQISLRAIQERERLNEQSLSAEINSLRGELQTSRDQGSANVQLLSERQAELQRREEEFQRLRRDREQDLSQRADLDRQRQEAIAEAQTRRQQAEAQAQELRMQVEQAQQQTEKTKAELELTRQQALSAQADLDRARLELAARDVEARRMKMQAELSRLASTRSDQRGFIVTLPGIFFDTGKSDLKAGARNTLTKIAEQLRSDDSVRVAVEGHTDNVGSEESNQALSEKRANAVRDLLASAGITTDRIGSSGRGESTPIATNKTAAGRQQNRRVELVITNQ